MGIKTECDEIDEGVSSDEDMQEQSRFFPSRWKLKSTRSMSKSFSR